MCTLVILRRPGFVWPLMIAANRDEMVDRPWRPPGRHWPDRPDVIAGYDELGGGSWLGINENGVVAAVLNRRNSLGPQPGMRSRGELVLEALDHAGADDAADALQHLDAQAYRPFNLVVADDEVTYCITGRGPDGPPAPECRPLFQKIAMLTAYDANDLADPRIALNLPRWIAAKAPDPEKDDWSTWPDLLASDEVGPDGKGAMNFRLPSGFGTVSSALIAVPDGSLTDQLRPVFRFASGHPDSIRWRRVLP